jgi:hypothetical protein
MNKTLLILGFVVLAFNWGFAQNVMDGSFGNLGDFSFISIPAVKANNNIKGSPYVTEEYLPAKISVLKNRIYRVRYNALMDEIVVKGEDDATYGLDKHGRKDITITMLSSNKTYQVFNYLDDRNYETIGYFIHMTHPDSNIKLLKKERIKFINEKKAYSSYAQTQPAHYKRENDKYYIKIKDDIAVLLPTKKNKIAQLFPSSEKEILSFIRSKKLNIKKEADLITLVNHISQLN